MDDEFYVFLHRCIIITQNDLLYLHCVEIAFHCVKCNRMYKRPEYHVFKGRLGEQEDLNASIEKELTWLRNNFGF